MSANKKEIIMNDREKMILTAIIMHYLESGESVGSRTLEKRYQIGVSSATIRNVMADLEDQGLIEKMHTSSGRIPTNKGYKLYVEELINIRKISIEEKARIEEVYKNKLKQIDIILEETSKLLSKITSYAGIVVEPILNQEDLKKIELVHVDDYSLLAVLVTNNSFVKTRNLYLDEPVSEQDVKDINKILSKKIREEGVKMTISDLEEIFHEISRLRTVQVENDVNSSSKNKIFFEGVNNLLESNIKNVGEVIDRARLLNNPEYLKSAFIKLIETDKYIDGEVHIIFGEDLSVKELEDFSFVFSVYTIGGAKGIIGVIGPKRMEYSKTVSLVDYISDEVKKLMRRIE